MARLNFSVLPKAVAVSAQTPRRPPALPPCRSAAQQTAPRRVSQRVLCETYVALTETSDCGLISVWCEDVLLFDPSNFRGRAFYPWRWLTSAAPFCRAYGVRCARSEHRKVAEADC